MNVVLRLLRGWSYFVIPSEPEPEAEATRDQREAILPWRGWG
jgi:hypothetical protein